MVKFVCVEDRVFFNKQIYNVGDILDADEELAKDVNKHWFESYEVFEKKNEKVTKRIKSATKENKSVETVIKESEREKEAIIKDYEEKIEKLQKQESKK